MYVYVCIDYSKLESECYLDDIQVSSRLSVSAIIELNAIRSYIKLIST